MFRLSSSPRPETPPPRPLDDAADPAGPDDARRIVRIGLWVLGIGFGGFLLWATLAPLDEGVAAPATVSIDRSASRSISPRTVCSFTHRRRAVPGSLMRRCTNG